MSREPRRWIDLHLHSTASDGAYAPAKLIGMAKARGLCAVALTDHETTAGLSEAATAAAEAGIEFVPGIEVAARRNRGTMHILGYFIDAGSTALNGFLSEMLAKRHERNRAVLDRLAELGIELDREKLKRSADGPVVTRPHIARALVHSGLAGSFKEAFDRYLADGAAAWVRREKPTAEEAIGTIRGAGGVATLAHPSTLGHASHLELETLVRSLCDAGLQGIEVYHPDHTSQQTRLFVEMAARFDLAITGGSDFHAFDSHRGGSGFGGIRVPYAVLAPLRKRAGV
ncbi:MAG: PHP domain-containing protein [Planctomycetota bacterium]